MSVADSPSSPQPGDETPLTQASTVEQRIILVDRTEPQQTDDNNLQSARTAEDASGDDTGRTSMVKPLSRKWTKISLQQSRTQRKYARYQEENFVERDSRSGEAPQTPKGKRDRGKAKVKELWHGKKLKQAQEEDAIIEVLYENQRGLFTFGIPHFSSRSLLNFDPKAWTNAKQRGSPVNITNAQVPDPNWEWAWKSWYVDMSRDVDEDGWEYSLAFYGCAWHGNHPWFHSFVRRRRWLRKRVRKHAHHAHGKEMNQRHLSEAHMLTPDYFTIHPSKTRSIDETRAGSIATSVSGWRRSIADDDMDSEIGDVHDIATLLSLMKRATVDREKIVLVRHFLQNADEEIVYLEEEIPHIMSILVFQNSRKTLLRLLVDELNKVASHRQDHKAQGKEEGDRESRRIDYLLKASSAADKQVKKLEYWSDVRHMVRDGKTTGGVNGTGWDSDEWLGIDSSGPMSNDQSGAKEAGMTPSQIQKETQIIERKSLESTGVSAGEIARVEKRQGKEVSS
ncbi:hypothetical protein K461DRAFT_276164 [Myriangium duriaei CBS 260.36]|uniref:Peroxin/Ferlin domain-containing protein n=1 Tax=Myriangium duriaei CBS 260.36 TaxID=1168546 RepID=A0A9P4J6J7_9PEZI|nr:hypothetical protein K461DRAFT_276164 [Myriangium duriaei CBS 260.36]